MKELEQLVEAAREVTKTYEPCCVSDNWMDRCAECDAVAVLAESLAALPEGGVAELVRKAREEAWIPVSERLPEIPDGERSVDVVCAVRCTGTGEFALHQASFERVPDGKHKGKLSFAWGGGDWDIAFVEPAFGVDGFDYINGPGDRYFVTHWRNPYVPPQDAQEVE